eukprot:Gb_09902 [translate_table: standard]
MAALVLTDALTLHANVVMWALQTFQEYAKDLVLITQADRLEGKLDFKSSSLDAVVSASHNSGFHTHQWLLEMARVVKPGGIIFVQEPISLNSCNEDGIRQAQAGLERSLLIAGFVACDGAKSVEDFGSFNANVHGLQYFAVKAQKPAWETGSSFSLKKKVVEKKENMLKNDATIFKLQVEEDMDDLIDEDSLLTEEDLKKPELPPVDDCEVGKTGRKACKNCVCGRADMEEKQQKLDLTTEQLDNPQSSCGSCGLGDAFRCSTCPYKGLPPFKLGEKVTLSGLFLTADV